MPKPAPATPFILILIFVLADCDSSSHGTLCPRFASAARTCGPCIQPISYGYATGLNGQVAAFPVDAATGVLGTPSSTPRPSASLGMGAIHNTFLYASKSESSRSIDAWTIDQKTGNLRSVAGFPFALGASALPTGLAAAMDNVGPFLYVADAGKIDAFEAGSSSMWALNSDKLMPAETWSCAARRSD
jgi:hypothetical protein